jgi:hypothetical protein
MLDAAASNVDDFFWRDTNVCLSQLRRNKMSLSPLKNYDFQDQFLSKINSVLSGQLSARCSCY